jgi:hypothetical protein
LRQLAKFLANEKNPIRMLASNLYIAPQYIDLNQPQVAAGGSPTPGSDSTSRKRSGDPSAPMPALPMLITPWMRAVTVRNLVSSDKKHQPTSA